MFESKDFEVVIRTVGKKCPALAVDKIEDPPGAKPVILDELELAMPLKDELGLGQEVARRFCRQLFSLEAQLDTDEEGAAKFAIERKSYPTSNLELYTMGLPHREETAPPALTMDSCNVMGKPTIHLGAERSSVLIVRVQGHMKANGGDPYAHVHSTMYGSLQPVQQSLPDTTTKDLEGEDKADKQMALAGVDEDLPQHVFSGKGMARVVDRMEQESAGFYRSVIEESVKAGAKTIGWRAFSAAAAERDLVHELGVTRAQVAEEMAH